jgi:hypothetical protein
MPIKVGQVFAHLTVIAEAPPRREPCGRSTRLVLVQCTCGIRQIARLGNLRSGNTASCGCRSAGLASARMKARRA